MTERFDLEKAVKIVGLNIYAESADEGRDFDVACRMIVNALNEIQQYRAYKEIFESHFSQEALELLSDEVEFGKWLERGKWIAKRCDEINRELEAYRAIGTIDELQEAKTQYDNINSVAESIALSGLCDFETAKGSVISTIKELKEKNEPKKPIYAPTYDTFLYSDYVCPNCYIRLPNFKLEYCQCGQKLD